MNDKQSYLDFLGSPQFLTSILNNNLAPLAFNKLFVFHVACIATQSTGIKEGTISLNYILSFPSPFPREVPVPQLNFSLFNTRYDLIEKGLRCTASSAKIKNKQGFKFRYAREMRNFLVNYTSEHMKPLHGYILDNLVQENFEIKYIKPKLAQDQVDYFFQMLILNNKEVIDYIDYHFLSSQLSEKNTTKKMKI